VTVSHKTIRKVCKASTLCEAAPKFPVLTNFEFLIVKALTGSKHNTSVDEGISEKHRPTDARVMQGSVDHSTADSRLVDDPTVDTDQYEIRAGSDGSPLHSQSIRQGKIIRILTGNPLALGLAQSLIQAGGLALIFFV
jgi:hypothetical protein